MSVGFFTTPKHTCHLAPSMKRASAGRNGPSPKNASFSASGIREGCCCIAGCFRRNTESPAASTLFNFRNTETFFEKNGRNELLSAAFTTTLGRIYIAKGNVKNCGSWVGTPFLTHSIPLMVPSLSIAYFAPLRNS